MATKLADPRRTRKPELIYCAFMGGMSRPRLGAPFSAALPSGATRSLRVTIARPLPNTLGEAIERGAVTLIDGDLTAMALCDANVVEAIVAAMGALETLPVPLTCRNCGEAIEVDPPRALPIGPLLVRAGDPELDPPMDGEAWHDLDRPIAVGRRGDANRFLLARRTLADRTALESMLRDDAPLPLGAPLIRALGIRALARGDVSITKSAIAIARALQNLDDDGFDDAWDAIARGFDHQHWSPRLLAPVACPSCGARHDVEAMRRPLDYASPRAAPSDAVFPELEAFRAHAATITRDVFAAKDVDVRGLEVIVDDAVPPCDDGGEPLLGSYTPSPEADGDVRLQSSPFMIALYYRTFRSMFEDEPYDVDGEIRETIEHELEHHAGFLLGDDPLDEEERVAIARERRRLVGGTAATELAAGAGWLAGDFGRFVRATWPVWLITLLALLILLAADR